MRLIAALERHGPEYLIEAALLAGFMIAAGLFGTLLEYPGSPVHEMIPDPLQRRALMGLAMGGTAVALIYSRWGMRSGAHLNPATTLTFLRLGRVAPVDALFYVLAQFAGGVAGVLIASALLGHAFGDPPVNHVATLPGSRGALPAFFAEVTISGVLMTVILNATNNARLHRYTGLLAGVLIFTWITLEAPWSGMSMNPARTFGSAAVAGLWDTLWIYFLAPPLGMLIAAELYVQTRGRRSVLCAKLHHQNDQPCIFRCGYAAVCRNAAPTTHAAQTALTR
jgi:aquaporin Z